MTALSTTPKTVVYSVTDLAASRAVFTALLDRPHTYEPAQVGGGRPVATVTDAEGNRIGLLQDAAQAG